jgi:hypothetical protein
VVVEGRGVIHKGQLAERWTVVVWRVSSWKPAVMTLSGVSCPVMSLGEGLLTVRMEPLIVAFGLLIVAFGPLIVALGQLIVACDVRQTCWGEGCSPQTPVVGTLEGGCVDGKQLETSDYDHKWSFLSCYGIG